ncbi:two-component system sensor histidine kinase [Campylobacter blaseri]|uniref:histidine kinase n=1 Tax=Campylobacter blaseri TaxID=2042961 RepID=A0A2P8R3H0_9BACT|nr:HAMP domain-containing sensor histidine kinase [Campylobacter blaseri]PSM53035.1 two-component sensor histidine kinase [Campylobacter blaseri]PSM54502.1 two-component sensor histidine kinase [Campylobacter blaseri]QKF85250.1 two-component system sensor histidine kinase [Campylobacter blaseri]
MFSKKHILPILLLYILTSIAFLGFFGKFFYEREKQFIINQVAFDLRDLRRELQFKLHETNSLEEGDFSNTKAVALNLRTKEYLKKDFDIAKNLPTQFFDGKNFFLKFQIHSRMMRSQYFIILKSTDLTHEFNSLKLKILLTSSTVLLIILLIAYFIVKLSLRPLYEKIEFLDNFIRDTTHEINTPLSIILMSIELFKTNPEKYLLNIKTASMTISNLYEDLVSLKMGNQEEQNKIEIINLANIINERIKYFDVPLEQKNITLEKNINDVIIKTSKFKITKIIDNLFSNAIKYCNENGVIKIYLKDGLFSISNTGEGISKENLPHIFELYTRFDKRNGGFGIGLNLVKKFIDELGFKITCKSDENKTEFTINFK